MVTLGIGVAFSAFTVLLVQGGLTLLAQLAGDFFSQMEINEISAVGGIIIIGLGLVILELKKLAVADLLPALLVVPLLIELASWIGW